MGQRGAGNIRQRRNVVQGPDKIFPITNFVSPIMVPLVWKGEVQGVTPLLRWCTAILILPCTPHPLLVPSALPMDTQLCLPWGIP